ncbi:MAG TPA: hypothetical protein VFC61_09950 [Blastocatellia bacterium]|nr:hypothetical protein [Blastocatellia bacterium]
MSHESTRSPVVLVVEELALDLRAVREWLETSGCRVVREPTLQGAVEDAADFTCRERPDLILLNLRQRLPESLLALRYIHDGGQFRNVPIVGLSETGGGGYCAFLLAQGGEVVSRPVAAENLPGLLDDLLARASAAGGGGRA